MSLMRMEGMPNGGRYLCGDGWIDVDGPFVLLDERNMPSDVFFFA